MRKIPISKEEFYRIKGSAFEKVRDPSTGEVEERITIANDDLHLIFNSLERILGEGYYRN